jgi:uncharacterized RDD family membrane protein YckC
MSDIEAGWYRDPAAPEMQRYWDGEQWVGKAVGVDETPPDQPEPLPPPAPTEPVGPVPRRPSGDAPAGPYPAMVFGMDKRALAKLLRGRVPANPGLRLVARLIDIVIVTVIAGIVNGWFIYQYILEIQPLVRKIMSDPYQPTSEIHVSERLTELQFTMLILTILVWFAYEVPATVRSGQTLGKRVMQIKAEPVLAPRMTWGLAISRWSLMMLSLACFPFGFIVAIADGLWCLRDRPFRQCLHDKNPGTIVIVATTSTQNKEGDKDVPPDEG